MSAEAAKLVEFNGTSKERKAIEEIANAAQNVLRTERHINISMAEAIPTIAYELVYAMYQYLDKNKSKEEDITINFLNLLDIGITYRESDDGEKEGNYTPYLQPGVVFKTTIKSDDESEESE